jgi:hypothetical protein
LTLLVPPDPTRTSHELYRNTGGNASEVDISSIGIRIALAPIVSKGYYGAAREGGAGYRLAIALVQWHVVVDRLATIKADQTVGDEAYALAA